jgi:hypothetical protein
VESRKSSLDKLPWRDLPRQEGVVEDIFIRPAYLGETVLPFRTLHPAQAVIPHDGSRLMHGSDERIDRYPGLADWWRTAEATWVERRSSVKRLLGEQLDYMRQLSAQFPVAECRVVYTKAGSNLTAAVIEDRRAVIDHKLYWAAAGSEDEALFLCAFLNSPALGAIVRPFQSVGAFGPRDFDKYVWQAPVPLFDEGDPRHRDLVGIARECQRLASGVVLGETESFKSARHEVRQALAAAGLARALDDVVGAILAP